MTSNINHFGNIFKRKRRLLARIQGVQRIIADNATNRLIKLEKKLKKDLEKVLEQEELL